MSKQLKVSKKIVDLEIPELESILEKTVHKAFDQRLPFETDQETAKKPISRLVPRIDVARQWAVSLVTLDKWVKHGLFPKPIKQGGRVYFLRESLEKHLEEKGGQSNG